MNVSETGRYVYICYLYKVYGRKNWAFFICFQVTCCWWVIICVFYVCLPQHVCACLHAYTCTQLPTYQLWGIWFDNFLKFWELNEMSNEEEDTPPHPTNPVGHQGLRVEVTWAMRRRTSTPIHPNPIGHEQLRVNVLHLKQTGNFTDFVICYIPDLTATIDLQKLAVLQGCPPGKKCEDHMCKKTFAFSPNQL